MNARKTLIGSIGLLLACLGLNGTASQAMAADSPAWQFTATPLPTNFSPGSAKEEIFLVANNIGAKETTGTIAIADTLPIGLTATSANAFPCSDPKSICTDPESNDPDSNDPKFPDLLPKCEVSPSGQTITCTEKSGISPGRQLAIRIFVAVSPTATGTVTNTASIEGGGAAPIALTTPIQISSTPPPFGFLEGFDTRLTEADGSATIEAGAHPYALTVNAGFPTERLPGGALIAAGHLRDLKIDFPRGVVINPAATPVLCTEAELITQEVPSCPTASAVGTITILTGEVAAPRARTLPLYNMVPPPGTAASLGFDALGVGVFIHVGGEVRNDGDYGLTGGSKDALALTNHPIFGVRVELWGDPSSKAHDEVRGRCNLVPAPVDGCSVTETHTDMLATALDCPGDARQSKAHADSWEETGAFKEATYELAAWDKCDELAFEPTMTAKPTTNVIDSPSGLEVELRQPQNFKFEGRATSVLKDITLTLPEGLVANPAQADGLAACTPDQIGMASAVGQTPIRFTKPADNCPDTAKIGSVSVGTPLLGQRNADNEIQRNPDGSVIPEPIAGSLYLAEPFANPFGSLLAVYLTVDDPKTGIVAKLAGEIHADPVTGRLSTTFRESPQLPIETFSAEIFKGPRAALRTPPACAGYSTEAELTPWSAPDVPDVSLADPFALTAAPAGGACPASAAAAPNAPSFEAGTITPAAGTYSPFVLRVSRQDGSQPLAGFEATLPSGLTAKLAGVPACTEAQIAAAKAREKPEQGALEQADPSCPAASEIGSVDAAAGSGPTPLHVGGRVYLAGPYKNAPLSAVIVTPAVAGPFDLGTVVVRAAIYLDRDTALVRTVSDPLPTILEGIPLDLRSATVRLGRPEFTLNPTSCEPKTVLATATSLFGQAAALSNPFQVGGCKALPYKPKLNTRLFGPIHRGGHPRLRAVFQAKPGEANTARIVFALPHSEFIDQDHFRTICTRVQFAANQCPAGSVYGHIEAISPLLDYPLEGPIYLRSSVHELPDVVAALHGPASQPIEIDLAGRVDSVNGGVRTTFESVPDAPVTKAIVTLQGGKKGLFQNSTNICKGTHRASLKLSAQSGKFLESNPALKADCKGGKAKAKRGSARR
jgi:hypothetical protein